MFKSCYISFSFIDDNLITEQKLRTSSNQFVFDEHFTDSSFCPKMITNTCAESVILSILWNYILIMERQHVQLKQWLNFGRDDEASQLKQSNSDAPWDGSLNQS